MGKLRQLNDKLQRQRVEHVFGSHKPKSLASGGAIDDIQLRDGGNHPETHTDDVAKREMLAIYNRYVQVYDKVSTTRKRTSYYRRRATIMQGVNEAFSGRSRSGSLVELILREGE